MKRKTKIMAVFCIGALLLSLLGACRVGADDADTGGSASGAPQDAQAASGNTAGGNTESGNTGETQTSQTRTTYTYQVQELHAQRDGLDIYGEIYIPEGAGEKMPAVIISHGFGGTHTVGQPYARSLAEHGYVAYCFDFCGGAPSNRSDGSPLEMSIFTEQADLEAVIAMVRELDYVDRDNLFLMGTSQGGAVSAITGAAHPQEIRGMILFYPAFIMVEEANQLFQSAEEIPDTYHFMWMDVGRPYFEALLNYDIYGAISSYDKDLLLIHGDEDSIVPLESSQRALEVYPSARLEVIQGGGHGFYGDNAQLAIDYMLEYLDSHRADPAEDTSEVSDVAGIGDTSEVGDAAGQGREDSGESQAQAGVFLQYGRSG